MIKLILATDLFRLQITAMSEADIETALSETLLAIADTKKGLSIAEDRARTSRNRHHELKQRLAELPEYTLDHIIASIERVKRELSQVTQRHRDLIQQATEAKVQYEALQPLRENMSKALTFMGLIAINAAIGGPRYLEKQLSKLARGIAADSVAYEKTHSEQTRLLHRMGVAELEVKEAEENATLILQRLKQKAEDVVAVQTACNLLTQYSRALTSEELNRYNELKEEYSALIAMSESYEQRWYQKQTDLAELKERYKSCTADETQQRTRLIAEKHALLAVGRWLAYATRDSKCYVALMDDELIAMGIEIYQPPKEPDTKILASLQEQEARLTEELRAWERQQALRTEFAELTTQIPRLMNGILAMQEKLRVLDLNYTELVGVQAAFR